MTMSREEQARIEIGETTVKPGLALAIVVAFLALLFVVPIWQFLREDPDTRSWKKFAGTLDAMDKAAAAADGFGSASLAANSALLDRIHSFEHAFDDSHILTEMSQGPVQDLMINLGVGNEKAIVGRNNWLFYTEDIKYLTGAPFLDEQQLKRRARSGSKAIHPDPRPAITDFQAQLAARGIKLVLMPIPVKPCIDGRQLSSQAPEEIIHNPSWTTWLKDMEAAGVAVYDCGPQMTAWSAQQTLPAYLETDTHWRPECLPVVAKGLTDYLRSRWPDLLPAGDADRWNVITKPHQHLGDIATMLKLPDGQGHYAAQEVTLHVVQDQQGKQCQAKAGAPVLLLGDSFTNIFSHDSLGWGTGAGLAEHLADALGTDMDCLARNDDGSWATRAMLADDLAQGTKRLEQTKVVVWEFACRELSKGDWRPISLPEQGSTTTTLASGTHKITGTVAAVSDRPQKDATYAEFMMLLHLQNARSQAGKELGDILVHVLAMEGRQIKDIANVAIGSELSLAIEPWIDVKSDYERLSTGLFEQEELTRSLPHWFGRATAAVTQQEPPPQQTDDKQPPVAQQQNTATSEVPATIQTVLNACAEAAQAGRMASGAEGWQFLGSELRHLGAGEFWGEAAQTASSYHKAAWRDPLPVIVETHKQLAASNIKLLVVPVPLRAVVYADKLPTPAPADPDNAGLPIRIDHHLQRFYGLLREQGVAVMDLTERFRQERAVDQTLGPICCRSDTHWSPRGAAVAGSAIVEELSKRKWLPENPSPLAFTSAALRPADAKSLPRIDIVGDLIAENADPEPLPVWNVADAAGNIPEIAASAPILLLSDSHGLVFSVGDDMHHEGAGLREHLALNLKRQIDHIGVKGSAIDAARIDLARRWHRNPETREATKVVIWVFAGREFTESGWRVLPLGPK